MTSIKLDLKDRGYEINIGQGLLFDIQGYINLGRKVFILTDDGVPKEYSEAVLAKCADALIHTVPSGEASKSLDTYRDVLSIMLSFGLSRGDALIAVGGGVVGDLAGFLASTYMRGIDFYNIPTTLLAMVDSSIGGKTAVNLGGTKNIVGTFYQPKGVIIDTDTLKTLSERLISAGLAESVKMAVTFDRELFEYIENCEINEKSLEKIIIRSLNIKKSVVEADEREGGMRKSLNFGHTFGHGIEAVTQKSGLYHGECVALGMLPMCAPKVRNRLCAVLQRLGLPTEFDFDLDAALAFVLHDKKANGELVDAVFCDEIATYRIEKIKISDFSEHIRKNI